MNLLTKQAIGIDLGATKIQAAVVDSKGRILAEAQIPTFAHKGTKTIIERMCNLIEQMRNSVSGKIQGIGVGVPGFVDNGKVFTLTNIPQWEKTNLKRILERKYKTKIKIENDADCFTLGESLFGKAKKSKYLVGLTLGTGVGGGIVLDKKIYKGKGGNGQGGIELGHIVINPTGPRCKCGMRGCLEILTSGKAVERIYKKIAGKKISAIDLHSDNSAAAKKTINQCSENLGLGLASIINALNPDAIAIGGGASRIPNYVKKATEYMKKKAFKENTKKTLIYKSKDTGAAIGAAALILNKH